MKRTKLWIFGLFARLILAPIIRLVAFTGEGTEACLQVGCLPMPVGYYSPVPDIKELQDRGIWTRRSAMEGIDFRPQEQLQLLAKIGKAHGMECDWPVDKANGVGGFYSDNGSFGYGCAAVLHSMIRHFKPKKVIEVGSGFSSLIIAEALKTNGGPSSYTIIDPYPSDLTKGLAASVIASRVELIDPSLFRHLDHNDLLFIDSGHTVRTGSDVNFLILDILPVIVPGVVIQIHDISLPYEYPEVYFTNSAFRMFWTEAYLLQAFLAFNKSFEVLLGMSFIMNDHIEEYRRAFPLSNDAREKAKSGSLWIRRVPSS